MTDNQKLIAAIAAGLLMMAKGCGEAVPNPPTPTVNVVKSFDDYRDLMGKAWTEGAAESFDSDRAAFEWIKGRAELARKAAFAPVHEREQATFSGDKWDDAKRKSLWQQFATESK